MTYGEAHIKEQMSLTLIDGKFVKTVSIEHKPEPMEKDAALKYYNKKLFNHWVNDYDYDKRVSKARIKNMVSALMFGSKDKYKELL